MRLISHHRTIRTLNSHSLFDLIRVGLLFVAIIFSHLLLAQDQRCGSKVPSSGEFENWMELKMQEQSLRNILRSSRPPVYQVPIVVHIFHKGEAVGVGSNLSEERIKAQIDTLNADFRRRNADAINTPADFLPVAADTEIEFVLAKQDPNGNPTNGIVRVRGEQNSYRVNNDKLQLRTESYWPPQHYMNIYVADLQVFIGFASFPVTNLQGISNESGDFNLDAVFVDYEYFGNNPSAPAFESRGRTLAHEIGHYFGLRHIWGDTNCSGDDFVEDTPTARFDHSGITSPCTYPIPDNANTTYDDGDTCTDEDDPNLPDMFQNYMDYTDDVCMNLFTHGQRGRMRIVLQNSPRRNSLLNSPALVEPTRFSNDLAVTRMLSPDFSSCELQFTPSIEVTNYGTNAIESFEIELSINGSTANTSSIFISLDPFEKTEVSLPMQEIANSPSSISYSITSVNGGMDGNLINNTLSRNFNELNSEGSSIPYIENFEAGTSLSGVIESNTIWKIATAAKETSANQSLLFNAYENTRLHTDQNILYSPLLDLSGFEDIELSFNHAYAYKPESLFDQLRILYSYNCGVTWQTLLLWRGSQLQTVDGSTITGEFFPVGESDWNSTSIFIPINNLTQSYGDQFQLAFEGINGSGNNLFLDDITINKSFRAPDDASIVEVIAPPVNCYDSANIDVVIRNIGFKFINSITVDYSINGVSTTSNFEDLNISVDQSETISLRIPTKEIDNEFVFEITEVNQNEDTAEFMNASEKLIVVNSLEEDFPFKVDFESSDRWINTSPSGSTTWERTTTMENGLLRANSFDALETGTDSWFVSPSLSTGGLDSAGVSFRISYASRNGFNDRLQVLASIDCGDTYPFVLLSANSDSLAVTETNEKWLPTSEGDWKEFELDLSDIISAEDEIRIAFVFFNGNGNDLYLDDISVTGNELPTYQEAFRVFPNPVSAGTIEFNLGFNLPFKEPVRVEMIDMSGKLVISQIVSNALNQIIPFEAPKHPGLYFIRVSNGNFAQTQKLFINP